MNMLERRTNRKKPKKRRHPPVAWYEPVVKPELAKSTAVETEHKEWTADDLAGALYMQIDMSGIGYSIAWKPDGRIQGHCTIAIGAPPQSLIHLCIDLLVPVVDLSVDGFSLRERSRLLGDNMGNYPEYGGDLSAFLDACCMAGASVQGFA